MSSDGWDADLSMSSRDFARVVWPVVRPWCRGGRLEVVEDSTAEGLTRSFDVLAGIDAWHLNDELGFMRGVASRVQWGSAWNTFTIRMSRDSGTKTEFEKRLDAIEQHDIRGDLYPVLTVQAYLDRQGGSLLSVGMVRTRDLFVYAFSANPPRRRTGNAEFAYIHWSALKDAGVRVRTWEADPTMRLAG